MEETTPTDKEPEGTRQRVGVSGPEGVDGDQRPSGKKMVVGQSCSAPSLHTVGRSKSFAAGVEAMRSEGGQESGLQQRLESLATAPYGTMVSLRPQNIKTIREDVEVSTSPFGSPGKRSDMSILSSPRGLTALETEKHEEYRTDPKKWVQNEEVLIPNYDEHDEDQALLKKRDASIWNELFPDSQEDEIDGQEDNADSSRSKRRERRRKFLRSRKCKAWLIISALQAASLTCAICILVYQPPDVTWSFQLWRIFFLIFLLPFTWIFGDFLCWLVVKFVEKFMFNLPNALYFAYATKEPLRWVMRFLALTIVWALMMMIETDQQLNKINTVYDYILRILGCITLFFTANLLKRFAAKSLALNLHKGKQQYKLEAALTKERILKALLGNKKPRTMYSSMKQKVGRGFVVSSSTDMLNKMMGAHDSNKDISDIEEGSLNKYPDPEQKSYERNPNGEKNVDEEATACEEDLNDSSVANRRAKQDLQKKRKDVIVRLNLLETYIRNHAIAVSFKDELNQRSTAKVENQLEAKRVGSFLYWNIKGSLDGGPIVKEDLEDYLAKEDLKLAFAMLDINGDGVVNLKECIEAVDAVYVERKNLSKTLKDGRNITKTLETLIGTVIHVVFIFLYLLIFQANVSDIWVGFSGVLLGFSFVFSRTVADVFDNVIFLFGTHPYSIGDLLHVDQEQMTVEEITLNFTCMKTSSNRALWMPNQHLIRNPFINLSKSGNFFESIIVYVDMDAVTSKPGLLSQMQQELEQAVRENSSEFGATLRANYEFSEVPMKLGIKVVFEFSHSGVNFKRCSEARTIIHSAIARVLGRENVTYTWPASAGASATNQGASQTMAGGQPQTTS